MKVCLLHYLLEADIGQNMEQARASEQAVGYPRVQMRVKVQILAESPVTGTSDCVASSFRVRLACIPLQGVSPPAYSVRSAHIFVSGLPLPPVVAA